MARKCNHSLFEKAKYDKKDEFYTQFADIEKELYYYKDYLVTYNIFTPNQPN